MAVSPGSRSGAGLLTYSSRGIEWESRNSSSSPEMSMPGPTQPYRCQYRPMKMSDCARYARYNSRGGCGRAPSSNSTGVSRKAEIARDTSTRSSASSASVELTNTRRRWSGVRIATLPDCSSITYPPRSGVHGRIVACAHAVRPEEFTMTLTGASGPGGRGECGHEGLLGDRLQRARATSRPDGDDGCVRCHAGGDEAARDYCAAAAQSAHAGHDHRFAPPCRLVAPPHQFDGLALLWGALVRDGQTPVVKSDLPGPRAEVRYPRPFELGVGRQAQEPSDALRQEPREVRVEVPAAIAAAGTDRDPEPPRGD